MNLLDGLNLQSYLDPVGVVGSFQARVAGLGFLHIFYLVLFGWCEPCVSATDSGLFHLVDCAWSSLIPFISC